MTPRAASLIAAFLIAAAPYAAAQSSDERFAGSLAAISAQAAKSAARQKADAAQAAQKASAAAIPALLARAQPDFGFTPGHLCSPTDPNFKEYRYAEHIPYCNRNVTQQMKQTVGDHYGVPSSNWSGYEFDHLIPLAIGGDSSIDNLWPQPHGNPDGSDGKDRLENDLYLQMKAGTITQAAAVKQIYDWFNAAALADKVLQVSAR